MISDSILIVFIKNPEAGKVKTRLAESVGENRALEIYRWLLGYTKHVVSQLSVDIQIWYSDFIPECDMWDGIKAEKRLQPGGDLGERMMNAFKSVFEEGYRKAVIIGSDCAEITGEIIEESFDSLEHRDLVIGPSEDGGYYLLGMDEMHRSLFEEKPWSSPELLEKTLEVVETMDLTYSRLPLLNDVDSHADWEKVKHKFLDLPD